MHVYGKMILIVVIGVLVVSSNIFSADIDVGEITEISGDREYIQVKDRTYKVERVEILESLEQPAVPGSSQDLAEGKIVQVLRGEKEGSFWYANLIAVYDGDLAVQMREKLELPVPEKRSGDQVRQQSYGERATDQGSLPTLGEDGIWRN